MMCLCGSWHSRIFYSLRNESIDPIRSTLPPSLILLVSRAASTFSWEDPALPRFVPNPFLEYKNIQSTISSWPSLIMANIISAHDHHRYIWSEQVLRFPSNHLWTRGKQYSADVRFLIFSPFFAFWYANFTDYSSLFHFLMLANDIRDDFAVSLVRTPPALNSPSTLTLLVSTGIRRVEWMCEDGRSRWKLIR